MNLDDFDFELPRELIAQQPVHRRTDARMMVIDRKAGTIEHSHVRDMAGYLHAADCLVVNDSKVIPARLVGLRSSTGGRWEGLYLREADGIAELLSKTRGSLQPGESISLRDAEGRESMRIIVIATTDDGNVLFRPEGSSTWEEVLEHCGRVPLPPYIRDGQMTDEDRNRYQTVYARNPGSVAAPTAGLHFTPELMKELRGQGVAFTSVTLHVGVGTFRPIQVENIENHRMHSEVGELSEPVAKRLSLVHAEGGRIIAVGTTSMRVLETSTLHGQGKLLPWKGETDIFIRPGFKFQAVDGLLTNFHLPKSSLLVLVSAFAGNELIRRAYREAVEESYRFFSYGDCMLIL